jgi:hypothetical protein
VVGAGESGKDGCIGGHGQEAKTQDVGELHFEYFARGR